MADGDIDMSLDFVYDLKEKLEEQKLDYCLLVPMHGKENSRMEVFYSMQHKDSPHVLCMGMKKICEDLGVSANDPSLEISDIEVEDKLPRKKDEDDEEKK